jgi:anti-sigma-K factor RskA
MNSALLTLVPNVAPPRRLKRRIMASIGVERSRWGWAAALAAACMLVVALWLSVQERQRTSELADARRTLLGVTAQRDRLQQALSFLDDPATLPVSFGKGQPAPPRGNVFVHPRLGVLLIASNLPPATSGRIYEMWLIPKGGAPRPAGLFQSEPAGTALHMLSGPVDTSTLGAIAVTLEPESGSPAPTTTAIIVAPVAGV